MGRKTRREFLGTCLYASLSGASAVLLPSALVGCRRGQGAPEVAGHARRGERSARAVEGTSVEEATFAPGYLRLHESGELRRRGEALWERMRACNLCPRECGAGRLDGEEGFCRSSAQLEISAFHPHFGEEDPLVGTGGSGAIFFTNCGFRCVFCINFEVSQLGWGRARSVEDLAGTMLRLQEMGCHNINVVTPTHYSAHIVMALDRAARDGLRLPLVYNTNGWERPDVLSVLDGIVDIYLPDFKYSDGRMAARYSGVEPTYPEDTQAALIEMNRQVGVARAGADGILRRGLIVRHLVMPNDVGGSVEVVRWIAANLPRDTYINIMSQYTPTYLADEYPEIDRRITREEYAAVVTAAREAGLTNLDIQGYPM